MCSALDHLGALNCYGVRIYLPTIVPVVLNQVECNGWLNTDKLNQKRYRIEDTVAAAYNSYHLVNVITLCRGW